LARLKARFCPSESREVEMKDMDEKMKKKNGIVVMERDDTMQSFLDKNQDKVPVRQDI
jgi:hypothetical protein